MNNHKSSKPAIRTLPETWNVWPDNPDVRLACLFALCTSCREAEILALNLDKIMDQGKVKKQLLIEVKGTKRGKKKTRWVYLPSVLREAIEKHVGDRRFGPLLISSKSNGVIYRLPDRTLRYHWLECQRKAGIDRPFRFHDLRHTAITRFWNRTKDLLATMEFAGHESPNMTAWYTHLPDHEIHRAQESLDGPIPED